MAQRFLGKTLLTGLEPLRLGGLPVLESHGRLQTALAARIGAITTEFFAEPITTWGGDGSEGSVSWYADVVGEPETLTSLSGERRESVETQLRAVLARVAPLLRDPAVGPLLLRALVLPTIDGVKAVGDRVVLTEWGLTSNNAVSQAEPMAFLMASPLGAYLPILQVAAAPTALPVAPSPPPPPVTFPPPLRGIPVRRGVWSWWLVPVAVILAALFLAYGFWEGTQLMAARLAARPASVELFDEAAAREALRQQREQNAALERDIEERRRALSGNVCVLDPAQAPGLGANRNASPPPAAVPPPPGAAQFTGTFSDLLKQATVMVLVPQGEGVGFGTGFYVTPDLIVTNRHVIEHAAPGRIYVLNEKLGKARKVELITSSPNSETGQLDVAILRLTGGPIVQPLAMTTTVAQLDAVIAAGYPALTIRGDEATNRLLEGGDATAAPQVIMTDGRINAIQDSQGGQKIMPHSAALSGGNSGGPLVDTCGRVVGVNTFIAIDQRQTAHVNIAQKADGIMEFLRANNVPLTQANGPCAPVVPTAPAAPAAPALPAR